MRKMLSTSQVARMLGVAVGSVAKWIDDGNLEAGRTPGGHRRIAGRSLLAFLRRQNLPVPPELLGGKPKVLIVDDEPAVAKWIAQEIKAEHADFEILQAQDGFAAGEIVARQEPDVVILDLRMPGIDGFEVCRRIKARPETSRLYVVAITAHPSPKARQAALDAGADGYMAKPLDVKELLAHVESALARRMDAD